MKIVRSDDHRKHFPKGELSGGVFVRPYECPERWEHIVARLEAVGLTDFVAPDAFDRALAEKVHDADYVSFLETVWGEWIAEGFEGEVLPTIFPARRMQQRKPTFIEGKVGYHALAIETAITEGTWEAATASAAIADTARALVSGGDRAAFALCRPPGHHAAIDMYGGYCFLNNAAIAAQGFLDAGAARVTILDVDFHHGNGTQDIFYSRDDVQFISLHGQPEDAFPHFLGYADETGEGDGAGYTINYPFPPGTSFSVWGQGLRDALEKVVAYKPDALVISLGVDTFEKDPISFFKLTSDDFTTYGGWLADAGLPTLFVMEGGYAVEEVGINTVNVLNGFLDRAKGA
ncbi:MAG: histone deacetylase family protein [Pseudomonadota bacterium]